MRAPLLIAFLVLAWPPHGAAHAAQDAKPLPVIGPAPSFALISQDGALGGEDVLFVRHDLDDILVLVDNPIAEHVAPELG